MSLWPIGGLAKSVAVDPNTLCLCNDAYSASRAACHLGQSDHDWASLNEVGSNLVEFVVYMTFGFGSFLLVFGIDVGFFCGRVLPVPGREFLMILGHVANPSGILSAIDFRCNNLVTSVSGKDV